MKRVAHSYKELLDHIDTVTELYISYDEVMVTAKLQGLKKLCFGYCQFEKLPKWISELKGLEQLELSYSELKELPEWLLELPQLKSLIIKTSLLEEIPPVVLKMKQLEELDLRSAKLQRLPKRLNLPKLKRIWLANNKDIFNKEVLELLIHLPSLEFYMLPHGMSLKYSYGKAHPDVYYFDNFFSTLIKKRSTLLEKNGLDAKALLTLCWLFKQDEAKLSKIPINTFYNLLNCTIAQYRKLALDHLNFISTGDQEDISGKKLLILGKLKVKKADYKDWLAETKGILVEKFDATIDYVILGEKPGKRLTKVLDQAIPILLEKDIWQIKDSAYLQAAPTMGANLKELLQNASAENLALALEIMEQGGMPNEVLEEVVALFLCHKDIEIRKRVRAIFDRYNTIVFPKNVINLLRQPLYRIQDDKKITHILSELAEGTLLDLEHLAYVVYKVSEKGQGQGLCLKSSKFSRLVIMDYVDKNGILQLSPHLVLTNGLYPPRRLSTPLYINAFPPSLEEYIKAGKIKGLHFGNLLRAPNIRKAEEFLRLKGMTVLNLGGINNKILYNICENKALKKLTIAASFTKLPKNIGNLKNLESLIIYHRKLSVFPEGMKKLVNLRTLQVNSKHFIAIVHQFKNLERLSFVGIEVDYFPKELKQLTKLKHLNLNLTENAKNVDKSRLGDLKKLIKNRK